MRGCSLLVVAALAVVATACPSPPTPPPAQEAERAPPSTTEVAVDGCQWGGAPTECRRAAVGVPTMCEGIRSTTPLDASAPLSLVVWSNRVGTIEVDGKAVALSPETYDGGQRWRLEVPPDATTISLRCAEDRSSTPCWQRTLSAAPSEPGWLVDARAERLAPRDRAGFASRRAALTQLIDALPSLDAAARTTALDIITDLALQASGEPVDPAEQKARLRVALHWTERAWANATAQQQPARASCHARRALRYTIEDLGELGAAQHWAKRLRPTEHAPLTVSARNDYYRALLSQREGDLPAARSAYLRAEHGGRRLSDWPLQRASLIQAATVMSHLGQEQQVEALFNRAREDGHEQLGCVEWLRLLNNHSWARYQLAQLGRPASDPLADLDDVLMFATTHGGRDPCHSSGLIEHARLNLGLVAAEHGWTGQAEHILAQLRAEHRPSNEFWVELLHQRLVLARRDRGELTEWLMRAMEPDAGAPPQRHWLYHVGRGQAYEALGLTADAIDSYRAAERSLDAVMRALDFDTAAERLLRGRQPSASRLVALLAARGDTEAALCAARIARRRTHDALDRPSRIAALDPPQRERWRAALDRVQTLRNERDALDEAAWSLPADALAEHTRRRAEVDSQLSDATMQARTILYGHDAPPPRDETCDDWRRPGSDELALLYFPIDAQHHTWHGFAFDRHGVRASASILAPDEHTDDLAQWSRALLDPFAGPLRATSGTRLLPTGRLWTVPFAALPWDGDPLLLKGTVTVSLDLAPRPAQRTAQADASEHALVVGDPHGDLRSARREAELVDTALQGAGWSTTRLVDADATVGRVAQQLPQASLVHYAGHAHRRGTDGWGSALRLAGGQLEVRDVLALADVPAVVMLPACDTASTAPGTLGGGMSVARAFLLAGADLVVAAQDELDDDFGLALARALYAAGPLDAQQGPARLREALLQTRPLTKGTQWWPVVALVP